MFCSKFLLLLMQINMRDVAEISRAFNLSMVVLPSGVPATARVGRRGMLLPGHNVVAAGVLLGD